jgi:predicted metal-dependent HD superfamily phosphohydrolase
MQLLCHHTKDLRTYWANHLPKAKAAKFAQCFSMALWFHDAIYQPT